jgi:hypothetical protein
VVLMRLRDRQSEIVDYLLSPRAFDSKTACDEIPAALAGLDAQRLRVLGLFSLGKRQEKVSSLLPKTWSYVRRHGLYSFRDFANRRPQRDATYFANASQYFDYLQEIWQRNVPDPPWLPDIARYEIEYAAARTGGMELEESTLAAQSQRGCVRRHRQARLSRYRYDIRPLLAGPDEGQIPVMRDIRLAFLAERSAQAVRIFELASHVFDVLEKLDSWSSIDQFKLAGVTDTEKFLRQLQSLGLIEVRI